MLSELPTLKQDYVREVSGLATAEVIVYTKKDMGRIEANERRAAERQAPRNRRHRKATKRPIPSSNGRYTINEKKRRAFSVWV